MPESRVEDLSAGGADECAVHYRSLLAAIKDGFSLNEVICDPPGQPSDFRILDVNPAFERMFNLKKEMLVGRTYRQLAAKVDPILIERCGRVALSGEESEFEFYSPKVERRFELLVYRPTPLQFAVLVRVSREEMRMVENLRICEAKSRALLESIPDLLFHISEDGAILDCRAPANGFLLFPTDFIGRRLDELLPPDLAQKVFARMVMAHKNSSVASFECRVPLEGIERDYEARMVYGKEGSFVLLLRDISEKKRIREALLESERRFRAAVDNIPHCIVIYDEKLRFRYTNLAAIEVMGLPEDDIFGHTNEELFSPEIIRPYIDHLRRALETRCIQRAEYTHDLPSGPMTFFTIYVPITDESGHVTQILGISHDITRIRETETMLASALEENKKQNRLLKTAVEELRSSYDEVEGLLYTISHDLMTPLILIEGFVNLLKKDVQACNRVRIEIDLGLIGDAVSRMKGLLVDSLELSSLGRLSKPAEKFPFEEIMGEAREHFRSMDASSAPVIFADEGFPPVYINRKRMADVLISMIDNCVKCSGQKESPRVHIGWKMEGAGPVYFTRCEWAGGVKDPDQVPECCNCQEGEDDSTSIGLAVSKRIIELQGGRMWMECTEEDCLILFTLPEGMGG